MRGAALAPLFFQFMSPGESSVPNAAHLTVALPFVGKASQEEGDDEGEAAHSGSEDSDDRGQPAAV